MNNTLMKLDIAAYLPFNLVVKTKSNEEAILIGLKNETAYLDGFTYACDIDDLQPFLRPISSLVENKHLFSHGILPRCLEDIVDGKSGFYLSELPYSVVSILIENHFDIHQLIDQGLAIEKP